jgi:hypothetical protein
VAYELLYQPLTIVTSDDGCLLGSSGVYTGMSLPTFQKSVLPPSSGRCGGIPHGATTQKTAIFALTAVRTSKFICETPCIKHARPSELPRNYGCVYFFKYKTVYGARNIFCTSIVEPEKVPGTTDLEDYILLVKDEYFVRLTLKSLNYVENLFLRSLALLLVGNKSRQTALE